ncbi:MAG: hypothetical protein AMS15_06490 [Planctomycetes bacterium DG_23]|nr:MAG: hypothetical protein AMS15_06490 [Planctomycetes bacterium DG_23]
MSAQGKLLRLRLGEEIRPPWMNRDEEVRLILPGSSLRESSGPYGPPLRAGEVLASFIDEQGEFPAVIRSEGKISFVFDLKEAMRFLLEERYFRFRRPLFTRLPFHYHLVPGETRVCIHKAMVAWKRSFHRGFDFPQWPIDKSVETLRWLALKIEATRGEERFEFRPFWPHNKKFAFVLSHDVDTDEGLRETERFQQINEKYGMRPVWFVPAALIPQAGRLLTELVERGGEIGLHGSSHDGKLAFLHEQGMRKRFQACLDIMHRFEMKGFRSPLLFRTPRLFEVLVHFFDYDSSVPDTELFTGCASVFPFFRGSLLELPITLPMDATLISMGKKPEETLEIWRKKTRWIEEVGGLALLVTHTESHYSANPEMLSVYEQFLSEMTEKDAGWFALPKEVAAWWRGQSGLTA